MQQVSVKALEFQRLPPDRLLKLWNAAISRLQKNEMLQSIFMQLGSSY